MRRSRIGALATAGAATALAAGLLAAPASAYTPAPGVLYKLPAGAECLKGLGNCVIYPKSAELPSGRLVAAFEKSTVQDYPAPDSIGGAIGQSLPVWASDDDGDSWQQVGEVPPPAELTSDPAAARYTSNWTNPYLYTLPETIGDLSAGTLLLASVVSGEDEYFRDQKAADPNWIPTNDGDRRDVGLALFASTDEGASWDFVNVIADGGWQGGSAGAVGSRIANANTTSQIDPLWEPHLLAYDGQLVAYYSDENDYSGYNAQTGVPIRTADNDTGPDSGAQILVHRTWDGTGSDWSQPVVDVAGSTWSFQGSTQIGGGRPGMTTLVEMHDGTWLLTFEYWGGGSNIRYKTAADPLSFFADGDGEGTPIEQLPVTAGSSTLATGGSPVLVELPDGRILYNAASSGHVWVNEGDLAQPWTEYRTTLGGGYSRNLQYVSATGRIEVLQAAWGGAGDTPVVRHAHVDLGDSAGEYVRIVNSATGQVIGTGGNTTDADIGNNDQPDVRLEDAGSASLGATQLWHVEEKSGGGVALLNKSGGRSAAIWTGTATAGQRIAQWVDESANGPFDLVDNGDGTVSFRARANSSLFLTGASAGAGLTLQTARTDGSQTWTLEPAGSSPAYSTLTNVHSGKVLDVNAGSTADGATAIQWTASGATWQEWEIQSLSGGYVQLVNRNSGSCLDVEGWSTANGGNVQQWACTGGTNQQWTVEDLGNGSAQLVSRHSGLCLDVNAWSTANGGNVQQWACSGGANQRWVIADA